MPHLVPEEDHWKAVMPEGVDLEGGTLLLEKPKVVKAVIPQEEGADEGALLVEN